MADPTPPTPPPAPQPRGYFNQGQLDDLEEGADILTAALAHSTELATRQITAAYLTGFSDAIEAARLKVTESGQATDQTGADTVNATGAERTLLTALQGIQSAAKQKHRMLAEDDDATTNFSTDGYLIGTRLNSNRASLLQNSDTLIGKAQTDDLPGHDAAGIKVVTDALAAYKTATAGQQEDEEARGADIISRDGMIQKINTRRMAIQHAADGLWPYTDKTSRPIRKVFQIPQSRPFNG